MKCKRLKVAKMLFLTVALLTLSLIGAVTASAATPKAKLMIEAVEYGPEDVHVGDKVAMQVIIRNDGNATATAPRDITFVLDGDGKAVLLSADDSTPIEPGGRITYSPKTIWTKSSDIDLYNAGDYYGIRWIAQETGWHNITASIGGSDSANNATSQLTRSFCVGY